MGIESSEAAAKTPLRDRLRDELADGKIDPATLSEAFSVLLGSEDQGDDADSGTTTTKAKAKS